MTNKDQLQKELLEKVKPGTKPSDIKKQRNIKNISEDEGYSSGEEEKIIPTPPPLPNQQIKDLQTQISSLKKQLQTYKDFKEADLKLKEKYKEEIKQLKEENKELKEKVQRLYGEEPKEIKTFACYNCKKQQNLSLLVLELPEGKLCQPCWATLRKKTKETVNPTVNKPFTCSNCQETKPEKEYKVKLDATLTEYSICSTCLPLIKEYNEKEEDSNRELEEWE